MLQVLAAGDMPIEYHFEKVWFMFYLFGGLALIAWLIFMAFPGVLCYLFWRDKRRLPRTQSGKMPWQAMFLCLIVPIIGSALTVPLALATAAPYLTRFDTEGVTYLSATGWKRELWSNTSKAALVPGSKQPILRVYLPYFALDFDSQMFVHPEEVARTLQSEVERHKKPLQPASGAAST